MSNMFKFKCDISKYNRSEDGTTFGSNKKVAMIKAIRTITGHGLREAKDCADALVTSGFYELPNSNDAYVRTRQVYELEESKNVLHHLGVIVTYPDPDPDMSCYVRNLREIASQMILNGHETYVSDIVDVLIKWKR